MDNLPPFPAPDIILKTMKGARESDTGQIASILSALVRSARMRLEMGPITSHNAPNATRPKNEARLKAARMKAAVVVDIPIEVAY